MEKFFLQQINIENVKNILDLGCGKGELALDFATLGKQVDAINKENKLIPAHENINFIQADITSWKIERMYDLIMLRSVLHQLDKDFVIQKLFPTLQKHVPQNGYIYIETMTPEIGTLFTPDEIQKMLPNMNFIFLKETKIIIPTPHTYWYLGFQKISP